MVISTTAVDNSNYGILRVYAYYRTLLSSILLLMFYTKVADDILGSTEPTVFFYTALTYTVLNIATLLILWRGHFQPKNRQIFIILLCDIIAMMIMMQTSGGVESSIGYLLLVCAAAGGIFLQTQASAALAAIATIMVIGATLNQVYSGQANARTMFSAGTMGILLFLSALTLNYLSNRIRTSNLEAASQAEHAAHLERMAQLIVERMRTGVLVANPAGQIELINQAAAKLLGLNDTLSGQHYLHDFPEIEEHLHLWKAYPHTRTPHIPMGEKNQEIRLGFATLEGGNTNNASTLIFIEDNRTLTQEAQQLKLASLGRLTASIAHEIRNPLGAISHASQLLDESPDLQNTDRRMTEIINTNTKRVNQIIENVLQLSRRRASQPEPIELNQWVKQFIEDYKHEDLNADIKLNSCNNLIETKMDTSHLNQVLTNLCNNGLRYSKEATDNATLTLELGIDIQSELPYIRVIDNGEGIAEDNRQHIFEPFFTTEASGSGLGLYISKELCQSNQASLNYLITETGKSCFQINFAHPKRLV
ncbi:two-component system sensor histidine kinase PilS [Maricurvus nonylphenolicus]|uniref:sensor histidine kinase n=1 Tax=Maricurvus nonylphenolicus TaxID=1008307 RepID=UPI0036F26896